MSVADVEKVDNLEHPFLSSAEKKLNKERLLVGAVKSFQDHRKKLHIKKNYNQSNAVCFGHADGRVDGTGGSVYYPSRRIGKA